MSIVVSSGSLLDISSGAAYSDVVINSCGRVYVRNGGVLSKAVLNYSGYLDTLGNAYDVTVNAGGIVYYKPWVTQWTTTRDNGHVERISSGICLGSITNLVISGDFAAQNAVMSDCVFDISNHGIWLYNTTVLGGTVNSTANVYFSAGCVMSRTLIDHRYFAVHSGAAITDVGVKGGNVVINSGAYARDTIVTDGGVLSAGARIDGTILRGGSQVVTTISYYPGYGYGAAFDTVVSNGGVHIISGGTGLRTVVSAGGTESVVGGYAISTTVSSGGTQFVYGGSAVDTEVYGIQYQSGSFNSNIRVHSGGWLGIDRGTAARIAVDGGAFLEVAAAAATAGNVSAANGANVRVLSNGTVSGGVLDGANVAMSGGTLKDLDVHCNLSVDNGNLYGIRLQSGAILTARLGSGNTSAHCSGVTVSGGAVFNISGGRFTGTQLAGGTVNNYGVNFQNWCVSSGLLNNIGGSAANTSVFDGGRVTASDSATESTARVSGGVLEILDGSYLRSAYIYGGSTLIGSGASAYAVSVYTGGKATVASGGSADYLYLRGGSAVAEGTLSNIRVSNGGVVYASGAVLSGGTVFSGGTIRAESLTVSGGVTMNSGSILDLVIANRSAGGAAVIDDLGKFGGSSRFYVTVSADQEYGQYILADGAAAFDKTVTVNTDTGIELGTLTVGGELSAGEYTYTLNLAADQLSLTVASDVPPVEKPTRGDFNGNGISDILFQNLVDPMNPLGAWMDADMWQWNGALGPAAKTDWTVYGAFDFTGDKVCDIMFRSKLAATEYAVGFYDMGEGGTFKTMGWGVTAEWELAQCGDFNGNGIADILWSNTSTGYHGLWLDGTDQWVALPYSYLTPGAQKVYGVGDVNNDGCDDILINSNGTLGAWDIAGVIAGTESAPVWTGFGISLTSEWETVGAADFDGNGTADTVVWNKNSGLVGAYMNNDLNRWAGIFPSASPDEWGIPGFGDYNGDGCDDVLVRNLATGALGYWSGKDSFAWNGIGWGVDSSWGVIA